MLHFIFECAKDYFSNVIGLNQFSDFDPSRPITNFKVFDRKIVDDREVIEEREENFKVLLDYVEVLTNNLPYSKSSKHNEFQKVAFEELRAKENISYVQFLNFLIYVMGNRNMPMTAKDYDQLTLKNCHAVFLPDFRNRYFTEGEFLHNYAKGFFLGSVIYSYKFGVVADFMHDYGHFSVVRNILHLKDSHIPLVQIFQPYFREAYAYSEFRELKITNQNKKAYKSVAKSFQFYGIHEPAIYMKTSLRELYNLSTETKAFCALEPSQAFNMISQERSGIYLDPETKAVLKSWSDLNEAQKAQFGPDWMNDYPNPFKHESKGEVADALRGMYLFLTYSLIPYIKAEKASQPK